MGDIQGMTFRINSNMYLYMYMFLTPEIASSYLYEDATMSCKSVSQVSGVSASRLFGLTSCLAEPCLCTFVQELYSVHCVHSPVQTSVTGNPSQF